MSKYSLIWDNVKKYKYKSIFCKVSLLILIIVLIPMTAVGMLIYRSLDMQYQQKIQDNLSVATEYINNVFVSDFEAVEYCTNNIILSTDAAIWLNNNSKYEFFLEQSTKGVAELLGEFENRFERLVFASIYSPKSNYVISNRGTQIYVDSKYDLDEVKWVTDYLNDGKSTYIRNVYGKRCFTIIQEIKNAEYNGLLALSFDISKLYKFLSQEKGSIYLFDKAGNVVFSNIENNISDIELFKKSVKDADSALKGKGKVFRDGKQYVLLSEYDDSNYYLAYVNFDFDVRNTKWPLIILIWSITLAELLFAFFATVWIYQIILDLTEVVNEKSNGEINNNYENEASYIRNRIIDSINRNSFIEKKLKIQLQNYKQMKSVASQLQFNPHFIFNTLQLINSKATGEETDGKSVKKIVKLLSYLLRESLDTRSFTVPLETEIEYAKKYVEIQKIKYEDKFRIEWIADSGLSDVHVLKFCIQPLIENAIFHGIKNVAGSGLIKIKCFAKEGQLVISVYNTGPVITNEKINEIYKKFSSEATEINKSIGLVNLNQRINVIFGNQYGCRISQCPDGTMVQLTFPYKKHKEARNYE